VFVVWTQKLIYLRAENEKIRLLMWLTWTSIPLLAVLMLLSRTTTTSTTQSEHFMIGASDVKIDQTLARDRDQTFDIENDAKFWPRCQPGTFVYFTVYLVTCGLIIMMHRKRINCGMLSLRDTASLSPVNLLESNIEKPM